MHDLSERLISFSIEIIKLFRKLPVSEEYKIIRFQLIKSATSSGANYEEAQGASSRADFTNKVRISLKEMRESSYWLRVMNGICEQSDLRIVIKGLIEESDELKNILGAICSKTTRKNT